MKTFNNVRFPSLFKCYKMKNFDQKYPKVEEAADKVKKSQNVLKEFKSCFQNFKTKLPSYFTGEKKAKSWDFQVTSKNISSKFKDRCQALFSEQRRKINYLTLPLPKKLL